MATPELPQSAHQLPAAGYQPDRSRPAVIQPLSDAVAAIRERLKQAAATNKINLADLRQRIEQLNPSTPEAEAGEPAGIIWLEDPVMIEEILALYKGRQSRITADVVPTTGLGLSERGLPAERVAFINEVFMAVNLFTAFKNLFGASHETIAHAGVGTFSVVHYVPESVRQQLNGRKQMETLSALSGGMLPVVGDYILDAAKESNTIKPGQGVVLVFTPPPGDARVTRKAVEQVIIQDGLRTASGGKRIVMSGDDVVNRYGGLPMVYVPASVINRAGAALISCDIQYKDESATAIESKTTIISANLQGAMASDFLSQPEFAKIQEKVAALLARGRHEFEIKAGGTLNIRVEGDTAVKLLVRDSVSDSTPNADVALSQELWPNAKTEVKVKNGSVTVSVDGQGNAVTHSFAVSVFQGTSPIQATESSNGQYTFSVESGKTYSLKLRRVNVQSELQSETLVTQSGSYEDLTGLLADATYADVPMRVLRSEHETEQSVRSRATFTALRRIREGIRAPYRLYGLDGRGQSVGGFGGDSDLGLVKGDRLDRISAAELKAALARKGDPARQVAWATHRIEDAADTSAFIGGAFDLIAATSGRELTALYAEFGTELIAAINAGRAQTQTLRRGTRFYSVSTGSQTTVTNRELVGSLSAQIVVLDIQGFQITTAILPCRNLEVLKIEYTAVKQVVQETMVILGRGSRQEGWMELPKGGERGERTTYETQQRQPLPYAPVVPEVKVTQNVSREPINLVNSQSQGQSQEQQQQQFQTMWNSIPINMRVDIINHILNSNTNTTNVTR